MVPIGNVSHFYKNRSFNFFFQILDNDWLKKNSRDISRGYDHVIFYDSGVKQRKNTIILHF